MKGAESPKVLSERKSYNQPVTEKPNNARPNGNQGDALLVKSPVIDLDSFALLFAAIVSPVVRVSQVRIYMERKRVRFRRITMDNNFYCANRSLPIFPCASILLHLSPAMNFNTACS